MTDALFHVLCVNVFSTGSYTVPIETTWACHAEQQKDANLKNKHKTHAGISFHLFSVLRPAHMRRAINWYEENGTTPRKTPSTPARIPLFVLSKHLVGLKPTPDTTVNAWCFANILNFIHVQCNGRWRCVICRDGRSWVRDLPLLCSLLEQDKFCSP